MSRFVYKARNSEGKLLTDEIESPSEEQAVNTLEAKGLAIVSIEDKGVMIDLSNWLVEFRRVNPRELSIFFRQLATIFSAGIPLFEALAAIEEQVTDVVLKRAISVLIKDIESGSTFSQALDKHRGVFSKLIITMVEAGERGGVLDEVLKKISEYLEKESAIQGKIRAAMRYPAMVVTVLGAAFILAITFIIPKFRFIFSSFKAALPLPTRILLGLNSLFVNYWLFFLVVVIGGYSAFKIFISFPVGRKWWDGLLLKTPVLGVLITKLSLSRFFRMLSAMISSGIPLVYALEVTANTADNVIIADAIRAIRLQIVEGTGFSSAMRDHPIFPATAFHMVAIGEKSGNIDVMLIKIADYFDEESDFTISNLTAMLEPFLIFFLAAMVLLLALGIFLPMWSMMQLFR